MLRNSTQVEDFRVRRGRELSRTVRKTVGGKNTARAEAAGGRENQTGVSSHECVPEHAGLSSYTVPQRSSTDED